MVRYHDTTTRANQASLCQIRLKGHLGRGWTGWVSGMAVALTGEGDPLLTGPLARRAAPYGLLRKVRDIGMPLVSVNEIRHHQSCEGANP